LVESISEYARKWLSVSVEIREFLLQNTTEHNIDEIVQVSCHNLYGRSYR